MTVDRRVFLQSGLAAAIVPKAAAAPAPKIPELARRLLGENAGRVDNNDSVGIIDFTQPSRVPRFHVVDMIDGSVASCLTAHGRGSDPRHTGFLERFSNDKGSNATSSGAYRTGSLYDGKYGRAMRLVGLDAENNNAEAIPLKQSTT